MVKATFIAAFFLMLAVAIGYSFEEKDIGCSKGERFIAVGFSPSGTAEQLILNQIHGAKKTIDIAAYYFTSESISDSLISASKRGVKIRVVADGKVSQKKLINLHYEYPSIELRLNRDYSIMHDKFIVTDSIDFSTGSFNYTRSAALSNAENVVLINGDVKSALKYQNEFNRLWEESR